MKPILFSPPMAKAILNTQPGTWPIDPIDPKFPCKSMTRRIAHFKMKDGRNPDFSGYSVGEYCTGHKESGIVLYSRRGDGAWETVTERLFPKYKAGDQLWVREMWRVAYYNSLEMAVQIQDQYDVARMVKFVDKDRFLKCIRSAGKWRPSIFMPREAARIFLEVKDVRIEKAQDITPYDVLNEGIYIEPPAGCDPPRPHGWDVMSEAQKEKYIQEIARPIYMARVDYEKSLIDGFSKLWNTLNEKRGYGWNTNPWVWIYEFMRIDAEAVKEKIA